MADVEIPPYDTREDRLCMGCGKRDKAYRDQVALSDGNTALYHADCHILIANCPVCAAVLEAAGTHPENDGLKDEKLHVAIHKAMAAQHEVFTSDGVTRQTLPDGTEVAPGIVQQ
jgi:hypothetical protein